MRERIAKIANYNEAIKAASNAGLVELAKQCAMHAALECCRLIADTKDKELALEAFTEIRRTLRPVFK